MSRDELVERVADLLLSCGSTRGCEQGAGVKIVDLLADSGLAASKSVARRLIAQGGVRVGDRKVTSVDDILKAEDVPPEGTLLHAGKKHVRRIVVVRP